MHKDDFLTIAEAATTLGISRDTIRRRIKAGEIKAELRPSPYGDQYYINPIELTGAVKNVDVVKVEQSITQEELFRLFKQAMQHAIAPLHSEIEALRNELSEAQGKALKTEISVLHDSAKAIEARQIEREAAHFDLVDKRLKELSKESRKGLWSRLFNK